MASTGLRGTFKLDNKTIDSEVSKNKIGVFVLGYLTKETKETPSSLFIKYVGRSDTDVNKKLKEYVGKNEQYTHFKFDYFKTTDEAFHKECALYHDFDPLLLDSKKHPSKPADNKDYRCKYCREF